MIDPDDIKLAIKLKITHNKEFSHRPNRATLEKWAESKNALGLPRMPKRDGIPLPQERFCLNATNFHILPRDPKEIAAEKQAQQQQQQQQQQARAPKPNKGRYGAKPAKKKLRIVLKFKR